MLSVVLHALVVAAPGLALLLGLPDVQLFGVQPPSAKPTWTWDHWRDGAIQADAEGAFERSLGLRGVFVRTDNTLVEVVGDAKPGSLVIRGDHGTLFVNDDIWGYTRRPEDVKDGPTAMGELAGAHRRGANEARRARNAARADHLAEQDVHLSETCRRGGDTERQTRWRWGAAAPDALRDALRAHGARFTDAGTVLREATAGDARARERVFSKMARHWSPPGACLVLRSASPCRSRSSRAPRRRSGRRSGSNWDRDLLVLLNRWEAVTEEDGERPPHDTTARCRELGAAARRRHELLVGPRGVVACRHGSRRQVRFAYYNSTIHEATTTRTDVVAALTRPPPTWSRLLDGRNVIIVELLESTLHRSYARDFLVKLRDHLAANP